MQIKLIYTMSLAFEQATQSITEEIQKHPHFHYQPFVSMSAMNSKQFSIIDKKIYMPNAEPYYMTTFKKEFINPMLVATATNEPLVVNFKASFKGIHENTQSKKPEFEVNVEDAFVTAGITELVENIKCYFNQFEENLKVEIKHPIYKNTMTLGWYMEYGKPKKISFATGTSQPVEMAIADIDKQQLRSALLSEAACKVRALFTMWGKVDKEKNILVLGIKPYVQAIEFQ
jgi:hypothetical protein